MHGCWRPALRLLPRPSMAGQASTQCPEWHPTPARPSMHASSRLTLRHVPHPDGLQPRLAAVHQRDEGQLLDQLRIGVEEPVLHPSHHRRAEDGGARHLRPHRRLAVVLQGGVACACRCGCGRMHVGVVGWVVCWISGQAQEIWPGQKGGLWPMQGTNSLSTQHAACKQPSSPLAALTAPCVLRCAAQHPPAPLPTLVRRRLEGASWAAPSELTCRKRSTCGLSRTTLAILRGAAGRGGAGVSRGQRNGALRPWGAAVRCMHPYPSSSLQATPRGSEGVLCLPAAPSLPAHAPPARCCGSALPPLGCPAGLRLRPARAPRGARTCAPGPRARPQSCSSTSPGARPPG